jgi:putative Ca2+/H+ antiporter (TMEM165/GDT1 family)
MNRLGMLGPWLNDSGSKGEVIGAVWPHSPVVDRIGKAARPMPRRLPSLGSVGAERIGGSEDGRRVDGLWLSLGLIFAAELGDKSQLMALALATRHRAMTIVVAITAATAVVHLLSVGLGGVIGSALPTDAISVLAGVAFLGFAAWTIRGDELDDDGASKGRLGRSVFLSVAVTFFLAELGDKTMLATVTLAADHGWLGVWIGSTVGMVAADALAIVVGRQLGARLPERPVKFAAAVAFVVFGCLLIFEGLR